MAGQKRDLKGGGGGVRRLSQVESVYLSTYSGRSLSLSLYCYISIDLHISANGSNRPTALILKLNNPANRGFLVTNSGVLAQNSKEISFKGKNCGKTHQGHLTGYQALFQHRYTIPLPVPHLRNLIFPPKNRL